MSDWKAIERILLRGGPCDGDRLDVVEPSDLLPVVIVQTRSGDDARYRKTGDWEQLRGLGIQEAFRRTWLYDWQPDA